MTLNEQPPSRWPLERALLAVTGTITLLSIVLGAFVSKWFLLAAALVGAGQLLYVTVGACPGSIVLRRACRMRSAIYPDAGEAFAEATAETVRVQVTV
jgi:hypothetical protein